MKVSELVDVLGAQQGERTHTKLGEIEVAQDSSAITVDGRIFPMDELAENSHSGRQGEAA